jgi:hypothetical protein
VFARDIDNNIMDQRALFERYVIVDSVEHEFFKVLLNSNTVIEDIIKQMTTGGRKFHPGKFINDAKIDAKYWQHRTIADLFIKWIRINEDNDPAFDPFNRDAQFPNCECNPENYVLNNNK